MAAIVAVAIYVADVFREEYKHHVQDERAVAIVRDARICYSAESAQAAGFVSECAAVRELLSHMPWYHASKRTVAKLTTSATDVLFWLTPNSWILVAMALLALSLSPLVCCAVMSIMKLQRSIRDVFVEESMRKKDV